MTSQLMVRSFFHAPTFTITHLIWDSATRRAAIIDPVLDYDPKSGRTGTQSVEAVLSALKTESVHLDWILETHAHADHLSAAPFIKAATGAPIVIGEHIRDVQKVFQKVFNLKDLKTDGSDFDRLVRDNEELPLGNLTIKALHTPGHTPACVSYLVADAIFVGDTLFMPDYGTARADFPGGDATALYRSIQRILALPPETRVFLCHDYLPNERTIYQWETTIAEQRTKNVHVHEGIGEAEFVAMRNARDKSLDMPVLILPSIQVNIAAGALPEPEDNGVRYLKIPLDAL
jgi:glyoxylase-like metal-dependent hydrolase (beta-lactamase superfamily II)